MAWLVVDKQNRAWLHSSKPIRINEDEIGYWLSSSYKDNCIEITLESAENLVGKKLTWENEPVEITNSYKDWLEDEKLKVVDVCSKPRML